MSRSAFSLPRASQQLYSEWYKKTIKSGVLLGCSILWVGHPLPCRFRSEQLKKTVGPQHVFILKKKEDCFEYGLLCSSGAFYKLPRRYFTTCFPNIQRSRVPPDNRVRIKFNKRQGDVVLPFIPDFFLKQKSTTSTIPTRKKRKMYSNKEDDSSTLPEVEEIEWNENLPQWRLLSSPPIENNSFKRSVMLLIRNIVLFADRNAETFIPEPFPMEDVEGLQSNPEHMANLQTVIRFVYHYCRAELGIYEEPKGDDTATAAWIEALKNGDGVHET
jgi:hypothetical protein